MTDLIHRLFNHHKFVRRAGMCLCFLSTITILALLTFAVLGQIEVEDSVSEVFIAVIGLNTVYAGLYQWSRDRDT